jgi:hypothetical protein
LQQVSTKWVCSRVPAGAVALLMGVVAGGHWLMGDARATQRALPHGRFGPDVVERAARRLYPHILPELQVQQVSVEPVIVYDRRHTARLWWCAVCSDSKGTNIELRWSDETGKLIWASSNAIPPAHRSCQIDRQQAIRASIQWLNELASRTDKPDWKACGPPTHNLQSWVVRLRSKSATATVNVHSFDGSLQVLDISP